MPSVQVVFVGGDLLDKECMKWAGVGAAPANADPEVRRCADYVAPSAVGNGAISDVFKFLIEKRYVS